MQQRIRGLVFDKDGTLFDFHATWSVWCDGLIRDLCGPDPAQIERLARRLDFDLDARRFAATSPMIAGTMEVIIDAVREVLPHLEEGSLRRMILTTTAATQQIEVAPLVPLLDRLIAAGMTLGLATNDSEAPARAHLARAGILDRFAFVAGYDSGHGAKPEAGQLAAFCGAHRHPARRLRHDRRQHPRPRQRPRRRHDHHRRPHRPRQPRRPRAARRRGPRRHRRPARLARRSDAASRLASD